MIQAHDWASSPLGPPETWPIQLRTLVSLMLGSQQPMFVVWGPAQILLYNDPYGEILGRKHPGAMGQPFLDVWSEIRDDLIPIVEQTYAGKPVQMDDITLIMHRKGYAEETHFAFSYTPVHDEDGMVCGLFCSCIETTQEVFAKRRLVAEGERLRELFRQAPGFFYVWRGPEHVFEMANDAYYQLIGRRDIIGKPAREALPEIEGQGFFDWADQAYASGKPHVGTGVPARIQREPGAPLEERFVTFVFQPIRDAAGQVTGLFVQGNDVTEEKRTEQALRELNATLERRVAERTADRDRMWRLSTDIMLVHRHDATITAVNPACSTVLGWPEQELLGKSILDLIHPDDLETVRTELRRQAEGKTTQHSMSRLRHKDGSYRWISWTAVPDGGLVHAVGRDVTAEKEREAALQKAEEQLRQAQKLEAVGQLTGGVAHDFNNLLQALSGCLTMIGLRAPDTGLQPLLDAGQQAVDRGAKLVQQLMAFARRESLRPEPLDVRDRVLSMSGLLERALRADIHLALDFAPGLWRIEVDPTQFELALINMAVNARDAMPEGGHLRIRAENTVLKPDDPTGLEGEFVRLSVSDTGTGMPAEVKAKAFDPFFTTKEVGKGSGLGLAQVYGLTQQAGGTAWIESTEGQGTSIIMLLRRSRSAASCVEEALPPPAEATRRSGRVLLVEDDPIVASTVAAALRETGYEVAHVATADDALPLLITEVRIDLLFSDIVMPGRLNGVDLAREARRLRPELPIVLATGYSEKVAQAEGIRILSKPYRIDELIQLLDAASGEKEKG